LVKASPSDEIICFGLFNRVLDPPDLQEFSGLAVNARLGPKREFWFRFTRVQQVAILQIFHLPILIYLHLELLAITVTTQYFHQPPALVDHRHAAICVEAVARVFNAARIRPVTEPNHHFRFEPERPRFLIRDNRSDSHDVVPDPCDRTLRDSPSIPACRRVRALYASIRKGSYPFEAGPLHEFTSLGTFDRLLDPPHLQKLARLVVDAHIGPKRERC